MVATKGKTMAKAKKHKSTIDPVFKLIDKHRNANNAFFRIFRRGVDPSDKQLVASSLCSATSIE